MPLVRTLNVGSKGSPRELMGLLNCTFYSGYMLGDTRGAFWDVCRIRGQGAKHQGYYLLAGTGVGGASTKAVAVLAGAGAVAYLVPLDGGTQSPLTGCTSSPPSPSSAPNIAQFVGAGSGTVTRRTGLPDIFDVGSAEWAQNGSWSANAPEAGWPHRIELNISQSTSIAFGKAAAAPGSTKCMARKTFSDTSTTAWTAITVPDTSLSDGYVKGRQGNGGYMMAITDTGHVDISTTSAPGTMIRDATLSNLFDIDFSPNAATYIIANGAANVRIAPEGWPAAGPPTWTTHALPAGYGNAYWVVAMDLNSHWALDGEKDLGTTTWYGVGTSDGGEESAFLVTKDFTTYYSMQLAGLQQHAPALGDVFPGSSYLRFCHDRLFVFNRAGVSISGRLGETSVVA